MHFSCDLSKVVNPEVHLEIVGDEKQVAFVTDSKQNVGSIVD